MRLVHRWQLEEEGKDNYSDLQAITWDSIPTETPFDIYPNLKEQINEGNFGMMVYTVNITGTVIDVYSSKEFFDVVVRSYLRTTLERQVSPFIANNLHKPYMVHLSKETITNNDVRNLRAIKIYVVYPI